MAKKKESPKEESTPKPVAKPAKAAAASKPAAAARKSVAKPAAPAAKGKATAAKAPEPAKPASKAKAKPAPAKVEPPKPASKAKEKPTPAKVEPPKAKAAPAKPAAPVKAKVAEVKETASSSPKPENLSPSEARRAKSEAQKAQRQAELQAAADAKAAKAAEAKAALEAKKAERAAALQAAAEARAAKLDAIRAANSAKIASLKAPVRAAVERKPAARPERPAKPERPERAARPEAKPTKAAEFSVGLSIALHRNWERVFQSALVEGAKAAAKQLEGMLKVKAGTDPKTIRELENDRRRLMRIVDKGISGALTRLIEPADLQIDGLRLNADGTRVIAPPKSLEGNALAQAKVLATYRDLIALLSGESPGLKAFDIKGASIVLNYGDSMPGDFFFSGTFKLELNFANPSASTVSQDFHLFQKKGKTLGSQLRIGFMHDLSGKSFGGQLSADFPVAKAAE